MLYNNHSSHSTRDSLTHDANSDNITDSYFVCVLLCSCVWYDAEKAGESLLVRVYVWMCVCARARACVCESMQAWMVRCMYEC